MEEGSHFLIFFFLKRRASQGMATPSKSGQPRYTEPSTWAGNNEGGSRNARENHKM